MRAALLLALSALLLSGCASAPLAKDQLSLADLAEQSGAAHLHARKLDDGGMLLNGKLEGIPFSLAVPWNWNRQAMVFANGYRSPGLPTAVQENPLADDQLGYFRQAYAQGFATGLSAYAKAGMAVQHGVEATLRLKQFVTKLGATRTYLMGGSMGGNITVALVEQHPDDFAGAVAWCGAVGGWQREVGWSQDVRAAYNYFTKSTKYELPGDKELDHSAIGLPSSAWPRFIGFPWLMIQFKRLMAPVVALFDAAKANPNGPEQRIIDNIVATTGAARDLAGVFTPILLVASGMDDMNETFGGSIYDNTQKVYHSPLLSEAENAALNAGIQRIKSDPAAVAYAAQWHDPTGQLRHPLMTVYNQIDPLVPQDLHEKPLREAVQAAGHSDLLFQREVPSKRVPLLGAGEAYAHCGFEKEQVEAAWRDIRAWVETGKKPE